MKSLYKYLMFTMAGALAVGGCAPIRTIPVPVGIEQIVAHRATLTASQSFRRERLRDRKRRAQKCTIGRNKKQRIGERKRRGR